MRRTSYQQGSLKLAERRKGKVWEFRWREVQIDGSVRRKNIVIGTLEEFPNESAAQAAVDALRVEINQQTPQQLIKNISLETLVNHYRQHELPDVFNKTKPGPDAADEDRKSLRHPSDLRGLPQEVDRSALGRMPLNRCQSHRSGKMAEDTLLQKNWRRARSGKQSEDSEHHECALFSRYSVGMGGQKSNYQCSSKRKTAKGTGRSDSGGNLSDSRRVARSSSDDDRTGCVHRITSRRTHRSPLGGCGFRATRPSRPEIGSCHGGGSAENGGITKRCAVGRANCRVAFCVAADVPIPWCGRLGICITGNERQTAVLARHAMEVLRQACTETGRNHQTRDVSHFPTHVWNAPERKRGEPKGRARAASSREHEGDHRRLYAGCQSSEAGGSKQAGEDGHEDCFSLTGPNWTMKKTGDTAELLYFVGVPDGI
jgi:hypothetical protein